MEISLNIDKEMGHRLVRTFKPCGVSGCYDMSARECWNCDKHCLFVTECMGELEKAKKNIMAVFPSISHFKILGTDLVMVMFTDDYMINIIPQIFDEITDLLPKGFVLFYINAVYNDTEGELSGKKELRLSFSWRKM